MLNAATKDSISPSISQAGLKAVFKILDAWGCSRAEKESLLGISRSTFYKWQKNPGSASINNDTLERVSYLLNIHARMRVLFQNKENVYGFMSMQKNNEFFNGRTPIEVACESFAGLYETCRHIDDLSGAQWYREKRFS